MTPDKVTIYCSVDDVYAKPILKELEKQTGMRIDALYDTEATKTAGIAVRIRAERKRPRGDVFWSSALLQTMLLAREGLLQPYQSPNARDIPNQFKGASGIWTATGVRPRVVIFHTSKTAAITAPNGIADLLDPNYKDAVGFSNPQFGTASDWVAALATRWGKQRTLDYFRKLKANGAKSLPGNSVVADRVAHGELAAGIADSDDYLEHVARREPIALAPIQSTADSPTVLVPVCVAMINGAPHPEAARKLIDALLARGNEQLELQNMPGVFSARGLNRTGPWESKGIDIAPLRGHIPDDAAQWPAAWDAINGPLAEMWSAG